MNTKITEALNNNDNVLLYKEDLLNIYNKSDTTHLAVYISTPEKGKTAIQEILKTLTGNKVSNNKTINQLLYEIEENTKDKELYLYINHFEELSKRNLTYYKQLEEFQNVFLIVNFVEWKNFIDENFLDKFTLISDKEFNLNYTHNTNIKYTVLLLLSLLIFLLFLRLRLSVLGYLTSAIWFTFLMYRSFYFVIR